MMQVLFKPFEELATKYRNDVFFRSRVRLTIGLMTIVAPVILLFTTFAFAVFLYQADYSYNALLEEIRIQNDGQLPPPFRIRAPEPMWSMALSKVLPLVLYIDIIAIFIASIWFYHYSRQVQDEVHKYTELNKVFMSNIQHELKTPISVIRTNVEVADDDEISEELRGIILQEIKSMQEMLDALLKVSRLSYASQGYSQDIVDLNELVRASIVELSEYISMNGKKISYEEGKGFKVKVHQKDMQAVIHNLIKNAVDYSPGSDIIYITLNRNEISIADKGLGIPSDKLHQIFEPFVKLSDNTNGTGLGLYVTKKLCEINKVDIIVNSIVNVGTTFKLVFNTNA